MAVMGESPSTDIGADIRTRLNAVGGVIRIVDPDVKVRADWRRAYGRLIADDPDFAKSVVFSGWQSGDLLIALAPSKREHRPSPQIRLNNHAVRVGERSCATPDSTSPSRRALRVLKALAKEAKQRGHQVIPAKNVAGKPGEICIAVDGREFVLALVASGDQLRFWLVSHRFGRRAWGDGKRHRIEQKLGKLLDELEYRADEARLCQEAREREDAQRRAALQPFLERARAEFERDQRNKAMRELAEQWRVASDLRALCDSARDSATQGQLPPAATAFAEWVQDNSEWIETLNGSPKLPSIPEPTIDDLTPYLAAYEEMRTL
ncbi:hypothetical protein ABH926_008829 [Catenulispora sp. GP43]|uniref:hypothetical protein n=1 Tax=Catenulispora sp. GP43 TaxID=3156263 RepID=UPI0035125448